MLYKLQIKEVVKYP